VKRPTHNPAIPVQPEWLDLRRLAGEAKNHGAGKILDPARRSWIKNVIVPILVREYVAERKLKNANQPPAHFLDSGASPVRHSAQQHVDTLGGLT
jgi:hypothetical protein